jgi:hypothetical protein
VAETGAESVAVDILHYSGLSINDLQRAFSTFWDAIAAACAEGFIYLDNLPDYHFLFLSGMLQWNLVPQNSSTSLSLASRAPA